MKSKGTVDLLQAKANAHVVNIIRSTASAEKCVNYAYWGDDVERYLDKLREAFEEAGAEVHDLSSRSMTPTEIDSVKLALATQVSNEYFNIFVHVSL